MSKSQLFQDLLVLFLTKSKRNGTFVEVGAGNGIFLSNSYLLETTFGWSGILAEPAERRRQYWKEIELARSTIAVCGKRQMR